MTPKEWLENNADAINRREAELIRENPGATILRPGYHLALDGKRYWNPEFIIAKGSS